MAQSNKFREEANAISRSLNIGPIVEWLAKTGKGEEALRYIKQMSDSQNQRDFNKAKMLLKKNVFQPLFDEDVVPKGDEAIDLFLKMNPIMNFYGDRKLGTYDEMKKNEHFVNSKYSYDEEKDGKSERKVPILRIVEDNGELRRIARNLDVSPQDLKSHIMAEWEKKKAADFAKFSKEEKARLLKDRKKVVNEFDANFWSGTLRTVAPELYAGMRHDIANGGSEAGTVASFDVPVLGKFDIPSPAYAWEHKKDIGLDAATNVAIALAPQLGGPIHTGLTVTGSELARLAGSSYYPVDTENVLMALLSGTAAGTIPAMVGRVLGGISGMGGSFRRAAMRKLRSIRRGEELPSVAEKTNIDDAVDRISEAVRRVGNVDNTVRIVNTDNAIDELTRKLNSSPKAVMDGKVFERDEVKAMLMSNDGTNAVKGYLTAPSKGSYTKWVNIEKSLPEGDPERSRATAALNSANELFPAAVEEITYLAPVGSGRTDKAIDKAVSFIGDFATKYGSIAEPAAARKGYHEGIGPYEWSYPGIVEDWKKNGVNAADPLAEAFNERYGEGN